jgi:hypothetical protein
MIVFVEYAWNAIKIKVIKGYLDKFKYSIA